MTKQCVDFYKEKLKIGDEVIPVLDEALLIGISGIVSKIEYNEEYDNYYITITDQKGDILLDGVDSDAILLKQDLMKEKREILYIP